MTSNENQVSKTASVFTIIGYCEVEGERGGFRTVDTQVSI
jgi:hypothetical protein